MGTFQLKAPYPPAGDQPKAIESLVQGALDGNKYQVLLGVTGSGKTFTIANVVERLDRPTLVLTHNKTLAAQLYQEFREFFPNNAVEYFVSYYDYYQPEAYVVSTDTYIEKDSSINDEIDKLRLRATANLLTRSDVLVVASVSCIYGLGSPVSYRDLTITMQKGETRSRDLLLRDLVRIQYERNDYDLGRGRFRVRGDVVEVYPSYADDGLRIEFWGDEIDRLSRFHLITGETLAELDQLRIAPAKHFVTQEESRGRIVQQIAQELQVRLEELEKAGKLLEAARLGSRTRYDMELIRETGICSGIENYSRIVENRPPNSRPYTLLDFFGKDWLMVIDESHQSIPQVGGMFEGDRSRKNTLVEYGWRLPCALDNRPMNFSEFEAIMPSQVIFVSATPGPYELERSDGVVVEQIVRPTGLLDPSVEVAPISGQMDRILQEIEITVAQGHRVLLTTLTKKMSQDLADYLQGVGVRARYLHSEIKTMERSVLLRDLRMGAFDVLVGINLLREGLDLPEVGLVLILDADKEGFLRNRRSLIQTMGRAARNVQGRVILFADNMTQSMHAAIDETLRRRALQDSYNREHHIVPRSTVRKLENELRIVDPLEMLLGKVPPTTQIEESSAQSPDTALELESRMLEAAARLDFEEAARLRDLLRNLPTSSTQGA